MHYVGIDIGGTYIKIGVISSQWDIIKICKFPNTKDPMDIIFDELKEIFNEYMIKGIGVGIAGLVDSNGNVVKASNIPFFNDFPLQKILKEKYKVDVIVENDATVATLGEATLGEGKNLKNFILLTLGTGIGGGLWLNKEISTLPMEVGHMTINYNGKSCSCGSLGCLEIYASARAIKDNLIERLEKGEDSIAKTLYEGNFYKITSEDIYKYAMEGDPLCRTVLKESGKALGVGLANLINIFGTEKIILAGGLSKAINIYVETAISEAQKRALKGLTSYIVISSLVDKGGVLGAVALLRNKIDKRQE